jgi:CubicO group peptidase (beta-lactamase class C family)
MKRTVHAFGTLMIWALTLAPMGPGGTARAQQLGERGVATAETPSLSLERLERAGALLERYVSEDRVPGAVALVLQNGVPVLERAVGWQDRESHTPMTMETLFRIASQSKALTSVAILSLYEEGKLDVDDPVGRFVPALAHTTVAVMDGDSLSIVPAERPITIRDLLTHTAGLSYGTERHIAAFYEKEGLGPAAGYGWYTADKDEPICQTMERLASVPFVAQPGERWVYGYNLDVLGCVVERASGSSLADFIRERITGPLGMEDTYFFVPPGQEARLATVYASGPDGLAVRAPEGARGQGHYVTGPRKSFAGGAGLVSTAGDYARFLEMIRNGGSLDGVRILSPRTVMLMTTDQSNGLYDGLGMGFGFGFEVTERFGANGLDGVGAFGWGGAYGSWYRVDPSSGLVLVLMIQLMPNSTDIRYKFPTLVYQALEGTGAGNPA